MLHTVDVQRRATFHQQRLSRHHPYSDNPMAYATQKPKDLPAICGALNQFPLAKSFFFAPDTEWPSAG
jgi:hypothetical protein